MIRTDAAREAERRAWQEGINRALRESEPAEAARLIVSLHVAGRDEQLPRVPVIGLEPGAIRGSRPGHGRIGEWRGVQRVC